MTNVDYYTFRISQSARKKQAFLEKGDVFMALFYLNAMKGFEKKLKALTLSQLEELHHEIR